MTPKYLLTIPQAGAALGIGRTSTYRLINEGKLATVELLGRRMVRLESVQRLAGEPSSE